MNIITMRLMELVTITGPNFFGWPASMQFLPTENEKRGLYWKYDKKSPPIPIDGRIASRSHRRITLGVGPARFESYEHFGVLRWLGLDGAVLKVNGWPPFETVGWFWDQIRPHCEMREEPQEWFTVKDRVCVKHSTNGSYTEILPKDSSGLVVNIQCDYPELGYTEKTFRVTPEILEEIITTPTQGWPPRLYYPSWLASKLLRWPTHRKIIWPQEHEVKDALELFIFHRLIDLLGSLSLFQQHGFLAAYVLSHCSGHANDIACLEQARNIVVKI